MKKLIFYVCFLLNVFFIYSEAETIFLQNMNKDTWVTSYYIEILKNQKREIIYNFIPYYKNAKPKYDGYDDEFHSWYEKGYFLFNTLSTSYNNTRNDKFIMRIYTAYFDIIDINDQKNISYVKVFISQTLIEQNKRSSVKNETELNWENILDLSEITFVFLFDGDYLDIFIDDFDNHFATYCRFNDVAWAELENLIYTNTCDLTNVTFPRRADKNHSVGTSCIVAENLRLRKEESTSSATLHTMKAGTQLTILQLGTQQTIDDITANWVQVQLADGTTGWCFGGYLLEQ